MTILSFFPLLFVRKSIVKRNVPIGRFTKKISCFSDLWENRLYQQWDVNSCRFLTQSFLSEQKLFSSTSVSPQHPFTARIFLCLSAMVLIDWFSQHVFVSWLQKWRDDYLQWNPENYAGIRAVKVQAEPLWKPDIMLYNT